MVSILKDELAKLKEEVNQNEKKFNQLKTEKDEDAQELQKVKETFQKLENKFEQSKIIRSNQDLEIIELR
jgi:thymidylate kinase